MFYRPSHIGFAAIDHDRVVFLDVRLDRYGLLPVSASRELLRVPNNGPSMGRHLDALAAAGQLSRHAGEPLWPIFPPVRRSALDLQLAASRVSRVEIAVGLWLVRARLRRRGLAGMLDASCARSGEERTDESDLARLALAFHYSRRALPGSRICLDDTLLFMELARRRGLACRIVFGVRLDPFVAHCWAQSGELVLTDPVHRIADFHPVYMR